MFWLHSTLKTHFLRGLSAAEAQTLPEMPAQGLAILPRSQEPCPTSAWQFTSYTSEFCNSWQMLLFVKAIQKKIFLYGPETRYTTE
ncbi:MAG: hypothetical protein HC780_15650 [Leptolyngbyaceae cyanobacterium CSU_1_3]|nr:hypothetical protein [Leptolyngbyaceae cyanobacterium CSU_1_3]